MAGKQFLDMSLLISLSQFDLFHMLFLFIIQYVVPVDEICKKISLEYYTSPSAEVSLP